MELDDDDRLAALRHLEILDTAPEEQFNDIVRLAAHVCGTPMAAISLVDEHRQWFKARVGLPVVETPRAAAFCAHTIRQRDLFEVADAAVDPRFDDNVLVHGELGIRAYAAAPLVTGADLAIGTLCVLDRRPRRFDAGQRAALTALAGQAMAQISLRQQLVVTQRIEDRFRAVVEQSSDLIVLVDAGGVLRYASPAARDVLGHEPAELEGRDIRTLLAVDGAARGLVDAALASPAGTRSGPVEAALRRRDGTPAILSVRSTNLIADPAVAAVVFNCQDVTGRRRAESDLERTRQQAVAVLETANDPFVQVDAAGRVVEWNRRAARVFGWGRDEVVGQPLTGLVVPPRLRARYEAGLARALATAGAPPETVFDGLETTAVRRDGTELAVELTVWSTATVEGDVRFSAFVRDVTERRALEDRLAHHALHDDLTGLPNRHLLGDRLETALARVRRDGGQVGVLFCDLDRFKVVNDSRGHSVGDEVLVEVAARLEATVRSSDTVVRFGGDEFVVVIDGVGDGLEVSALAERIRRVLEPPVVVEGQEVPTSVSIGFVVGGSDATAEQLVSDADAAMYLAKERGRDRTEVFGHELRARVRARHDDERALRRALEEGELRVHYQPIVALADRSVVGAEALVRWERPGFGLLPPSAFVPLAEETGLVVALGAWVLGEACAQLRTWRDVRRDRAIGLSVNVAARQVANDDLAAVVVAALAGSGLEPGALTLELTETSLIEDLDRSASTLTELQAAGVHLAIDDFGTGYSSLGYLKALPIDTLKVDRSFVVNLGSDPHDSAIVTAISTMARSLDLRVVAEGAETVEHVRQVRAHGFDFAQGYHFARPMDEVAFLDLIVHGACL